jgi:2'-5' RNA ligase
VALGAVAALRDLGAHMSSDELARLFIGLWPDDAVRRALAAHRDAWRWPKGAALVDDARLHATLHFLGDQPRALIPALLRALAQQPFVPFALSLSQPTLWHGGLAVLQPVEVPQSLIDLQRDSGLWLQGLGIATEERPYRPHVTLARRAFGARAPLRVEAIEWAPPRPVLVESERGSPARYRVLI